MYILNIYKVGDSIPPCVTPFDTQIEEETMCPHLMHICWCEYQYIHNLIINKGTLHFNNNDEKLSKDFGIFSRIKFLISEKT